MPLQAGPEPMNRKRKNNKRENVNTEHYTFIYKY